MTWLDSDTLNWRPSKSDVIGLYSSARDTGMATKDATAWIHKLMWMEFGKTTSKDLTYSEYEKLMAWIQEAYFGEYK